MLLVRSALPHPAATEVVHCGDRRTTGTGSRSRWQPMMRRRQERRRGHAAARRDAASCNLPQRHSRADIGPGRAPAIPSGGRRASVAWRMPLPTATIGCTQERAWRSIGTPCAGVFARRWPDDQGAARQERPDAGSPDGLPHFPFGGMGARGDRPAETRRRCRAGAHRVRGSDLPPSSRPDRQSQTCRHIDPQGERRGQCPAAGCNRRRRNVSSSEKARPAFR